MSNAAQPSAPIGSGPGGGHRSPNRGPSGHGGLRSAVASLQSADFRWVFASNMAFFIAMGGQTIARPWLAFQLTDRPLALGIISACVAIPMLLLAPFGGVLADRVERRRLIVLAQSVAIVCDATILFLLITGQLAFWHMVALAAAMGCSFPLIMPARQAIVVNIVGKKGLGSAMALNMAGVNITRIVGPAAAGFMIPFVGVEGVYVSTIALYSMAVFSMTRIARLPAADGARDASILSNLVEGVRYVRSHSLVGILLLYGLIPMFLAMPFQTMLVVFSEEVWHRGSMGLGILNAAAGMGGVAGSIVIALRGNSDKRVRLMLASAIGFGGLLALFAISPWFLLAVPMIFGANIFMSIFGTLNNTAIQLIIPDKVRGRISSFLMMSFSLPMLGSLPLSAVAEGYGVSIAVAGAAGLAMLTAVLFYALSPDLRGLDSAVRKAAEND